MNRPVIGAVVSLVLFFAGCKKDSPSNNIVQPNGASHTVEVATSQNVFSLNLTAVSYTSTLSYPLTFTTDSLAITLNITGQADGSGSLKVTDASNATVYADSLSNNQAFASTQAGRGIPQNVQLVFSNFTGVLSFALAKNNGGK
jgi:PBP1b-binding outer membrane lipoprotein LpoB